jgi:hypothetical protein
MTERQQYKLAMLMSMQNHSPLLALTAAGECVLQERGNSGAPKTTPAVAEPTLFETNTTPLENKLDKPKRKTRNPSKKMSGAHKEALARGLGAYYEKKKRSQESTKRSQDESATFFLCPHAPCNKAYRHEVSLNRHIRQRHTGKKPAKNLKPGGDKSSSSIPPPFQPLLCPSKASVKSSGPSSQINVDTARVLFADDTKPHQVLVRASPAARPFVKRNRAPPSLDDYPFWTLSKSATKTDFAIATSIASRPGLSMCEENLGHIQDKLSPWHSQACNLCVVYMCSLCQRMPATYLFLFVVFSL